MESCNGITHYDLRIMEITTRSAINVNPAT